MLLAQLSLSICNDQRSFFYTTLTLLFSDFNPLVVRTNGPRFLRVKENLASWSSEPCGLVRVCTLLISLTCNIRRTSLGQRDECCFFYSARKMSKVLP